jgi:hypothetical protein
LESFDFRSPQSSAEIDRARWSPRNLSHMFVGAKGAGHSTSPPPKTRLETNNRSHARNPENGDYAHSYDNALEREEQIELWLKQAAANWSPRKLGTIVKGSEVQFRGLQPVALESVLGRGFNPIRAQSPGRNGRRNQECRILLSALEDKDAVVFFLFRDHFASIVFSRRPVSNRQCSRAGQLRFLWPPVQSSSSSNTPVIA